MTSSIITISFSFFCASFFSIKIIFEQVVTLSVKKIIKSSPECFMICYNSCITIAKECFAFLIRTKLQLRCNNHLSISLLVFKGRVRYIFASLFFRFKREHLGNKEKCFLFHFKRFFRYRENQISEFQIFNFMTSSNAYA